MFLDPLFAESFANSSAFYVQDPTFHEEEALRTIEAALAHGVNMLDTACNKYPVATPPPPLTPPLPPHQGYIRTRHPTASRISTNHSWAAPSRSSAAKKKWRNAGRHSAATFGVSAAARLWTCGPLLHAPRVQQGAHRGRRSFPEAAAGAVFGCCRPFALQLHIRQYTLTPPAE